MTITVRVPRQLRERCDGAAEITMAAATVTGALELIERSHPALYRGVCDETGTVRRHINLFVNKGLVRGPQGMQTALESGDVLTIMPAVSGG
jgi:molybdopterin converting factor small subunit